MIGDETFLVGSLTAMTTTKIVVEGMTCGHCVNHVTEALKGLSGVTDVDVQLEGGNVTIESATSLDEAAIKDAVSEAGYSVVS